MEADFKKCVQRPRVTKAILKNKVGKSLLQDIMTYYEDIIIKLWWHWCKDG